MKICKHTGCEAAATFGNQCQSCRNYKQRYGLTSPQVKELLDSQLNLCGLCNKPLTLGKYKGVVDHCHTTGRIRGILCHDCNVAIGYIENSKIRLGLLKDYLN